MAFFKETGENSWEASLFFDPEDGLYGDHFPGNPVVPGSLITHALLQVSEAIGLTGKTPALQNFRFNSFISPGTYRCSIRRMEDRILFALFDGKNIAAEGVAKP